MNQNMNLDDILTLTDAAAWLGLNRRVLLKKCKGRKATIPAFRLGVREYRFHPRTIIAKLAADSGVSFEIVAASMGRKET
jgi:hypothetical protein